MFGALVARGHGRIAYIDAPLVDYVQHERNVRGHRPRRAQRSAAPWRARWQQSYVDVLLWRQLLALTLLLRCGPALSGADRRAVQRTADGPANLGALLWRVAGAPLRRRRTHGHEWRALRGALWLRAAQAGRAPVEADGPVGVLASPAWPTA